MFPSMLHGYGRDFKLLYSAYLDLHSHHLFISLPLLLVLFLQSRQDIFHFYHWFMPGNSAS